MSHGPGFEGISVLRGASRSCAPPRAPVTHAHFGLALYTGGSARIEHHGVFEIGAGEVHLVPAGDPHRTLAVRHAEVWGVGFHAPALDAARRRELLAPFDRVRRGASPVVRLPAAREEHVRYLLGELAREAPATRWSIVVESLLVLVLAEVARADGGVAMAGAAPSLVADALACIEERCLGELSVADVARSVGRSASHLTTAVRRATGRSVQTWITEGRLAEARRRLSATDERVDVIGERVGYADVTHFIRVFKRKHGATPAAWRAAGGRGALEIDQS